MKWVPLPDAYVGVAAHPAHPPPVIFIANTSLGAVVCYTALKLRQRCQLVSS